MTLREMCESVGIDAEPFECAFVIAAVLRTAVQREPSTFEGECASLNKAAEHFDLTTGDGIRAWLADLGRLPDLDLPDSFWLSIADADRDELDELEPDFDRDDLPELTDADRAAMASLPPDFTAKIIAGYRFRFRPDGTFSHWVAPDGTTEGGHRS